MDPSILISEKRTTLPERKRILTDKEYELINQISEILGLVIMNTLEFNKLTSAQEIFEKMIYVHDEKNSGQDLDIDLETVENICQLLCSNRGILVMLVKNNVAYYKLNHNN